MAVQKSRPALWILVPITLSLAFASIWGTVHYGPFGKPSRAAAECRELREFIVDEEVAGLADWNNYRDLVNQYLSLPPESNRTALVEEIAFTVVQVLEHDLEIYNEMDRNLGCLSMEKKEELPGIIAETESAINFLNGTEAIEGSFFDPEVGSWNADYYNEFISATEFLKDLAKEDADV